MDIRKELEGNIADVTEQLENQFKEWQTVLLRTDRLLDLVINNTSASIISIDEGGSVFLKNNSAKKLIDEVGEDTVFKILSNHNENGIFDIELSKRYFHITVNKISKESDIGFVYIIEDVTLIKKTDAEKLHNEKLQLMGEMAANIAHEVRNPLGSIELFASLLARDLEADPEKKRSATSIVRGVRSINNIISNTLLFTKEMKVEKKEYMLSDVVDEVVLYLQHIIKDKGIKVVNKLDGDETIYCDQNMYKQVVMNILNNACDAVGDNGVITLSSYSSRDGSFMMIEDNGSGIPADMINRLFMPFQTTKASGTGLGLSIAYKIIKAHGGDITAENMPTGSRFTIITPMCRI